jgi:intracellular sulfur oxidation DsrE/DsrF family protein
MKTNTNPISRFLFPLIAAAFLVAASAPPAVSGDYAALDGVDGVKAVFDVSSGSAETINIVFGAVRNVYEDPSVNGLAKPPKAVVVFHGPAVKLISTDTTGFNDSQKKAVAEFADTIRQMKKEGVTFEVCMYAVKVLGVDPATILPEIDKVGNGFIAVVGYQAKGYSVVTIN